ncbi:MAG: hypothetical protein ACRD2X_15275 [Vicinamibacteraceae bacterium]
MIQRVIRELSTVASRGCDNAAYALGRVTPLLLVTGFWRSGTTWLQQCLADALVAKTTFEPLSPVLSSRARLTESFELADQDHAEAFIPYLDGDDGRYDAMWSYLESVVGGYCQGKFGLMSRKRFLESFRTSLVIKCVRLQFSHRACYERFKLPIVHLRRHPCAVVASMRDVRWHWHFRNVNTMSLLYGVRDGREACFEHCRAAVSRSNGDLISRIAAYWALSEAYVARSLGNIPHSLIVHYEDVVTRPVQAVNSITETLALGEPSRFDATADSPTTEGASVDQGTAYRVSSWQTRLTPDEVERVYAAVSEIFPEWDEQAHAAVL